MPKNRGGMGPSGSCESRPIFGDLREENNYEILELHDAEDAKITMP
jgi:hypothetical protein